MKRFNEKYKLNLLIVFTLLIVFMLIYFKKITGIDMTNLSVSDIKLYLQSNRENSVLLYMILNLIRPLFLVIPAWIFAVVSGVIYGPLLGTIYALIGIFISSTIAFYLARLLGRDFFKNILGNKFDHMDNKLKKSGFKVIFIMRVTVVFPFDPLSFIAGLSKISYTNYIIATMLGVIPETIAFNYLGMSLSSILSMKMLIILSIVCLIVGIVIYKGKRKSNKKIICEKNKGEVL